MPTMRRRPILPVLLLSLLIVACDGGGGGVVQPPAPDTLQRLLTDEELATPADPGAPAENAAWAGWIAANHHPVRSLTSTDHQDLQFLKPLLAGRRLVQLGESGHGVRQFNQAKVRLIRFLHEEMGYDVVAFESSQHDCWQANRTVASSASQNVLVECLFQVWHTREVLSLMDYVRQRAGTSRPLLLAGVDVQPTSKGLAVVARAGLLRSALAVVDSAFAASVHDMDAEMVTRQGGGALAFSQYLAVHGDSLAGVYGRAEALLRQHRTAVDAHFGSDRETPAVALATARSMAVYIRQQMLPPGDERYAARDAGMADNVDFLLDELYPGKKVVVWAHNSHVATDRLVPTRANMGSLLHERRGAEMYTVGLYMYSGFAANNGRQVYEIPLPHPGGSLESILYRARRRWTFVDLGTRANTEGTSWMFGSTRSRSWGVNDETIVPRDFYDGVLFFHSVAPPEYLQ